MVCLGFFPPWPLHLTAVFPGIGPYKRILIHNLFLNEFLKRAWPTGQCPFGLFWNSSPLREILHSFRGPELITLQPLYEMKASYHMLALIWRPTQGLTHIRKPFFLCLKWTACLLMTQKIFQQVVVHPMCCHVTQFQGASNVIWWGLAILQFLKHWCSAGHTMLLTWL